MKKRKPYKKFKSEGKRYTALEIAKLTGKPISAVRQHTNRYPNTRTLDSIRYADKRKSGCIYFIKGLPLRDRASENNITYDGALKRMHAGLLEVDKVTPDNKRLSLINYGRLNK